jgi:hypothetical protein
MHFALLCIAAGPENERCSALAGLNSSGGWSSKGGKQRVRAAAGTSPCTDHCDHVFNPIWLFVCRGGCGVYGGSRLLSRDTSLTEASDAARLAQGVL